MRFKASGFKVSDLSIPIYLCYSFLIIPTGVLMLGGLG